MIRRVRHSLHFATDAKKQKLSEFFVEYARVVNAFICIYWNVEKLPSKASSEIYSQVDSWMMGKARKCAVNQAVKIIRSTRKADKKKTYEVYQRAYARAKKLNRNIFGILSARWSVWSKGRKFRHRVSMPFFKGNTVDLNSDLVTIYESKSSVFDLWIRVSSIFGNRLSLLLPTKHHKRSRMFESENWVLKKSITLRKDKRGRYYADLYWEKEDEEIVIRDRVVGIDVGLKKLLACSDGSKFGLELKSKLDKLNRRKRNSRNWKQTTQEIKDYIGYVTNRIPWSDVDVIVMENLVNITKETRKRVGKPLRKMLGHWNIDLLFRRMVDKSEENRVFLAFVEPAYSSQTCSSCGETHKKSRTGEMFKCVDCGYAEDADYNASLNVLRRFLDGKYTVSRGTKSYECRQLST